MNSSWLVKVNFLLFALLIVGFAIFKLRSGSLERGIAMVMGVPATQQAQAPKAQGRVARVMAGTQLSWCDKQVMGLEGSGGLKLEQKEKHWEASDRGSSPLDTQAVLNWFSRYCSLNIKTAKPESEQNFKSALTVKFEDGADEVFQMSEAGLFRWRGQTFRSQELEEALTSLKRLPSSDNVK